MGFDESKMVETRNLTRKEEWTLKASKSKPGKYYYFNVKTGECSWFRPNGYVSEMLGKFTTSNSKMPSKRKSDIDTHVKQKKTKEEKADSHASSVLSTPSQKYSPKKKIEGMKHLSQVSLSSQSSNRADTVCKETALSAVDRQRKKLQPKRKVKSNAPIKGNKGVSVDSNKKADIECQSTFSITSQSNVGQNAPRTTSAIVSPRNPFTECHTNKNSIVAVVAKSCELLPSEITSDAHLSNNSYLPRTEHTSKVKAQERLNELRASLRKKSKVSQKDLFSSNDIEKSSCSVKDDRPQCTEDQQFDPAGRRSSELQSSLNGGYSPNSAVIVGSVFMDAGTGFSAIIASNNNNCHDVEAMEVEYMESEVLFDIEELRQKDCFVDLSSQPVFMDVDMESAYDESDPKSITYLVLDTNILLSHLNFTAELLFCSVPGKGLAHLFIPWQVLHELDHLKDKGKSSIQPLARRAINFLHDMFSAKHPRVRGQKISEATKDASNCADNNILQSSLQLKEQGFDVILVSNDTNLRNKALVSEVDVASKDQLASQICKGKEDCFLTNLPLHKNHLINQSTEVNQGEGQKIVNELKMIIKETVTQVVSKGMKDEYKHLWEKRTVIPPPWEHDQALHCLSYHWLALCDDFIPSLIEEAIRKLREFLKSLSKSNCVNILNVKECVELTKAVFRGVSKKYNGYTNVACLKLKELEKKLSDDLSLKKDDNSSIMKDNNSCQVENYDRSHLVFLCFEEAHSAASKVCGEEYLVDSDHVQRAKCMIQAVGNLVHLLNILLPMPVGTLKEDNPSVIELFSLIKGNSSITPLDLVLFLENSDYRDKMANGILQFTSFKVKLGDMLLAAL